MKNTQPCITIITWIKSVSIVSINKLDMCLWNTDALGGNKVRIWKNLQVQHYDSAPPQGHVMSVKCEQHLDEFTVQVWLLYLYFKYCTLFVGGAEQMEKLLDIPLPPPPRA